MEQRRMLHPNGEQNGEQQTFLFSRARHRFFSSSTLTGERTMKRNTKGPQLTRDGYERLVNGLTFDTDGWFATTLKDALRRLHKGSKRAEAAVDPLAKAGAVFGAHKDALAAAVFG
jgi:hypothetical protein